MPIAFPTIRRTFKFNTGTGAIGRAPTATPAAPPFLAMLDADIAAWPGVGWAVSMCGLGFDAGKAPATGSLPISDLLGGGPILVVVVNGVAEFHAFAFAFVGGASSRSHLSIEIQEFSPNGTLIGSTFGPRTRLFDMRENFIGVELEGKERQPAQAVMFKVCVPGNTYRPWIRLDQYVEAWGLPASQAVSNAAFQFKEVLYAFL